MLRTKTDLGFSVGWRRCSQNAQRKRSDLIRRRGTLVSLSLTRRRLWSKYSPGPSLVRLPDPIRDGDHVGGRDRLRDCSFQETASLDSAKTLFQRKRNLDIIMSRLQARQLHLKPGRLGFFSQGCSHLRWYRPNCVSATAHSQSVSIFVQYRNRLALRFNAPFMALFAFLDVNASLIFFSSPTNGRLPSPVLHLAKPFGC